MLSSSLRMLRALSGPAQGRKWGLGFVLSASFLLTGCVVAPVEAEAGYYGGPTHASVVYTRYGHPPPLRREYRPPPPAAAGYAWQSGLWVWQANRYQWRPGRWAHAKPQRPGSHQQGHKPSHKPPAGAYKPPHAGQHAKPPQRPSKQPIHPQPPRREQRQQPPHGGWR